MAIYAVGIKKPVSLKGRCLDCGNVLAVQLQFTKYLHESGVKEGARRRYAPCAKCPNQRVWVK